MKLVWCTVVVGVGHAFDMGPTFNLDYAGQDYNVTLWNTTNSTNHYEAAALACEQFCLQDDNCCAWTYCPPAPNDAERCCLKDKVPNAEGAAHWTGLAPRAVVSGSGNATLSRQCDPSVYPGPTWGAPLVHHSPPCLHENGWHDVAGAITVKGGHHVFQGCPHRGGWSHAYSEDLVHWEDRGIHVSQVVETYKGMNSDDSPCSGFVTLDDEGVVQAGFRQCGSSAGTTELNPHAHPWDVPLEVRAAKNTELTEWGEPEFIDPIYYYRGLPYDPVRPWKEGGKWYYALSVDACNSTTKQVPCAEGGQLDLFEAASVHGPWTQLKPLFTTNTTYSGWNHAEPGKVTREFVTSGYFGNISGDPDPAGSTRVVTQNNGAATYWVGKQTGGPGSPFVPYWEKPGAVGYYDHGSLTMARTLGSDPNQVAVHGRRVLVGWIGGGTRASQSLGRDLTLSSEYELLQQFVPELQALRQPPTGESFQVEVFAQFSVPTNISTDLGKFGVNAMSGAASISFDCGTVPNECTVGVGGTSATLYVPPTSEDTVLLSLHAIIDGEIIEVIFNNRTAMVVYLSPPSANSTHVDPFSSPLVDTVSYQSWDLKAI